ncbi:MAG: flagellar hook-associated protein 2 [Oceanicoccus sp.]|jgi:flagellar hook-associated protein 2
MATITASGIGSGIDISGLVQQLVNAERARPEQLLNQREAKLTSQISAIGSIKSAISTFQDSLDKLSDPAAFTVFSGSSSDEDIATVTTNENAQQGSFDLVVTQLATAYKSISTGFADAGTTEVGTGNITIANGNGDTFSLNFAGGGSNDNTLNNIRDAINNDSANFGVTATVLSVNDGVGGTESKLVLTSNESGTSNALTITADASLSALDSSNLTAIGVVQTAELTIDNQAITSASNSISDAISGVNFELIAAGSSTLTVNNDIDAVAANVEEFVTSFNALKKQLSDLSSYNEGNPGALFGDSTIRNLSSQINDALYSAVGSITGDYDSLLSVGISSDAFTSEISLDTDKLKEILATDFNAVSDLFTATDGIATSLDEMLTGYNQFAGLLDSKKDSLNDRLSLIDDSRERIDYRLGKMEARLTAQFIAMDSLVQTLNSTGSFLTQQLANLPGVLGGDN